MTSADVVRSSGLESFSLLHILRVLRQRVLVIVAAMVLLGGGALAFSLLSAKQYTATAKLLFRDPGFDTKVFGSPVLGPSQDPAREAATNVSLVSLDTITERASESFRGRLTANQIRDKVAVLAQGQSNVVAVMATDRDRAFSARLANTIARQYIAFRRDADRGKINQAAALVRARLNQLSKKDRAGLAGAALRAQIDQLGLLASLQTGNAELVQPALAPRDASSPKPMRNTLVALFFGLLLGVGLALALDRLDRRMRHRGDAELILERPILGVIPESRALAARGESGLVLDGLESDAFRTLRTNLRYFAIDKEIHSLLITSSAPADGKSTVALYLAATAAASNVRTVLLEADLRRPSLGNILHVSGPGLSDVLAGNAKLADVTHPQPLLRGGNPLPGRTLDVISSGSIPPNPTDLLESERMGEVLGELERLYDLVIIDTSPVTIVPDAIPIMARVSGVMIVIREGKSTSTSARHLRKQLDNLGIQPLGIVINGATRSEETGYSGYYGYTPGEAISLSQNGSASSPNGAAPRSRWGWRRGGGERRSASAGSRSAGDDS